MPNFIRICLLYRCPRTKCNLGQFFKFEGCCTQIWCARLEPKSMLTRHILSRSVYSVAFGQRKTPNFTGFRISAFCDVTNWQHTQKVEQGCTTTNPPSNGVKIVSVLQCLHGQIGCTNSDVQKRDRQANRQTKNSTFLATPAAGRGWNPSPTKLGTMVEDLEHVLAPLKLFRIQRTVSLLEGPENLGKPIPST